MAPDVLLRKLTYMRQLLTDLAPYSGASLAEITAEHYKVERLLELLVMTASDILFHKLEGMGISPESYRDAFKKAAEEGMLPDDLAARLQLAAGMRNILVHMYEDIDYKILRDSVDPALNDFGQFVRIFSEKL